MSSITPEDALKLRKAIVLQAEKLLGVPYRMRQPYEKDWSIGKWVDLNKPPESLDCSGLVEGVFRYAGLKMPHGSQQQFDFTVYADAPQPGDLAFFRKDKGKGRVYHVGIVFDEKFMIEARDKDSREWTGKVCLRERSAWENYANFAGYRRHPDLA